MRIYLTVLFSFFLLTVPAAAEEQEKTPLDILEQQTLEMIESMEEPKLEYIYAVRSRDGIIRAVHVIRRDVGKAIDACSESQPDMEDALRGRFSEWKGAVEPILDEAEQGLQESIDAQHFIPADELREHLALVKKAAEYTESKVEKTPVTDKDGCQYLLDNMANTQENLTQLLQETLASIPLPEEMPEEDKTQEDL